jgi:uncharacterized protein YjbI with pentapeptide repeats
MAAPPPNRDAPAWPHCGLGADAATNPVGCRGILVPGHRSCLAHVTDGERDAYLTTLAPGADIDHRGTPFTEPLLRSLLRAVRDPTTGQPCFGTAWFDEAQFSGDAWFTRAKFIGAAGFTRTHFSSDAVFDRVQFTDTARFEKAQFSGDAGFTHARFSAPARFGGVQVSGDALFTRAHFSESAGFGEAHFFGDARFTGAHFDDDAWFTQTRFTSTSFDTAHFSTDAWFLDAHFRRAAWFVRADFSASAWFEGAQFYDSVRFTGARFKVMSWFGPVVCADEVDLSGAMFDVPVTLEIAARTVRCARTRWEATATLLLRYARADLTQAVLSFPMSVATHPVPFSSRGRPVDESLLTGCESTVRVVSVAGADAANLVLTDAELSECMFTGAFHLDQIHLEGRCTFGSTPTGLHRHRGLWPYKWTRRRTLAEEHHWRAQTAGQPYNASSSRRWRTSRHHPDSALTPDPEDVAALYRQLRKAFEDGKNEPGAADFYYGEMEMRRHDRTGTALGERSLLWAYWLVSGYGLRASRAVAWLAASMLVTILMMMGFGLPQNTPKQEATGSIPFGGGSVTFEIDKDDPKNPTRDRFSGQRFEKALKVTLNSVVFRSSGQDLTVAGEYIEMASRFSEPILLTLAALAVRGRVKR